MDQEQLREFAEQAQTFSSVMTQSSQILSTMIVQMQRSLGLTRQDNAATQQSIQATDDLTQSTGKLAKAQKDSTQTSREYERATKELKQSSEQIKGAFGTLTRTVLNTDRNFKKYGDSLSQAGDAAVTFGKTFGPMGAVAGNLVKALTFLAEKSLEQADNLISGTDNLRRMGAAGAFTSEEFLGMAHASGVVSQNLNLLVKPMQNLGTGMVGLGGTVGQGVKRFAELTAVTEEQRMQFRRLGIDQEELIESQAAYLQLQNATGRRMQANFRSTDQLQKASLDYTRNLIELASLTGKDIDQIKKEQQAVLAREEFMIRNSQMEREIARLRKDGADEAALAEASRLEAQLEATKRFAAEVGTVVGDADLNTAIMQMITSGGAIFSEETAALARQMGMTGEEFGSFLARLEEGEAPTSDFLDALQRAVDATVDQVGDAAIFGGAELRKAFLMSSEILTFGARRAGVIEAEAREQSAEDIAEAERAGFDRTMDARARLTELEIRAGVEMDNLLKKLNPLVSGLTGLNAAVYASIAALTAFTLRLGMARTPGAASAARGGAARLMASRGVAMGGGALIAAAGVAQAGLEGRQRREDIQERLGQGEITQARAEREQRASTVRTGTQAGGVAGGALAGAALGSFIPGVGTAIGGFIGAGIGAWLGREGGKLIGDAIGNHILAEDVSEELKELDAELALARAEGKSEEEINLIRQRIAINEELTRAIENNNQAEIDYYETKLRLLDASNSENEELISGLEQLSDLDEQRATAVSSLAQAERELAGALESDNQEQRERAEKILEGHRSEIALLQERRDAHNEILALQQQMTAEDLSEAETNELQNQLDLRNQLLAAITSENAEERENLDNLREQIAAQRESAQEEEQRLQRIAELKQQIQDRGFDVDEDLGQSRFVSRSQRDARAMQAEMRELENLSQPSIGSDQTEEGEVQSTQTVYRAEISGFRQEEFRAANPEAFAEFQEYRKEAQEQLMQGFLDNLSDETKERMEEDPRYRRHRTQLARSRAENHALILAADKFQTEIEEATDAVINISEGYSDLIRDEIERFGEDAEDLNEVVDLEEQKNRALELAKSISNGLNALSPRSIFSSMVDRFRRKQDQEENEVEGIVDGIGEVTVDEAPSSNMDSVLSGIRERISRRAGSFGEVAEVPFPEFRPFNISPDIASPANQLNEVQQQMTDELGDAAIFGGQQFLEEMVELQKAQVEMFGRLESLNQEMVDKLDEGNEVSDQILKHSY